MLIEFEETDGKRIWVNPERVSIVRTIGRSTVIRTADPDQAVAVVEPIDQVVKKINYQIGNRALRT